MIFVAIQEIVTQLANQFPLFFSIPILVGLCWAVIKVVNKLFKA